MSNDEKWKYFAGILDKIKKHHGLLIVQDMVWNHTAHSSPWLKIHPEAGYNLENSPHLQPAFDVDQTILDFSRDIEKFYLSRTLKTEEDLEKVLSALRTVFVEKLKLWEYYILDVGSEMKRFDDVQIEQWPTLGHPLDTDAEKLILLLENSHYGLKTGCKRFEKLLNLEKTIDYVQRVCIFEAIPQEQLRDRYRKFLDEVNLFFYQEYDKDLVTIFENIKSHATYQRLDPKGPCYSEINEAYVFISHSS